MAPGNIYEVKPQRGEEVTELTRLRRELEEVRTRLDEETAYYRAEIEASRRRLERDSTRLQADEVARRRRLEQQLTAIKAELRETQQQLAEVRRREAELKNQLAELEAAQNARVREAMGEAQAAASSAWEEAERELSRHERELAATRQMLSSEQQARKQLEESLARAEQEAQRARQAERDAGQLVSSLKKALWATAKARRRAETLLATLQAEAAQEPEHRTPVAASAPSVDPVTAGKGGVHEISESTLKSVFFGELSDSLADDFLLTPGDASLDSETLDQLRSLPAVTPEVPPPPIVMPAPDQLRKRAPIDAGANQSAEPAPSRRSLPPDTPVVATRAGAEREPMLGVQVDGMRRLLRNLTLGVAATGGLYWLLTDGNGQRVLAMLSELLR